MAVPKQEARNPKFTMVRAVAVTTTASMAIARTLSTSFGLNWVSPKIEVRPFIPQLEENPLKGTPTPIFGNPQSYQGLRLRAQNPELEKGLGFRV